MKGWVYCIADEDLNYLKFGYTTGNLINRMRSLQTGNPQPLMLLAKWRATPALERLLHERWIEHRMCGEWFAATGALLEWAELMLCWPQPEIVDAREARRAANG